MSDLFRERMQRQGRYMGEALKRQSDVIMDATFTRDIAYRKCYIQDKGVIFPEQTLAGYMQAKAVFAGEEKYDPSKIDGFKPIDAKYLIHTYRSITSNDLEDYYLQFRPNAHGVNPNIRVGAFVFIPDDLGIYHLWLIVAKDSRPQFPQFYILECDFLAKWHVGEKDVPSFAGVHVDTGTYFSWCVARSQSSYNSGVWTDYLTTSVENQKKLWFPTNSDTQTLVYNQHITISNNPYRHTAWEISKVEDTAPIGVTKITLKQELEYDAIDHLCWVNTTSNNISDTEHSVEYDFFEPRTNDKKLHTPVEEFDESMNNYSIISFTGVKPSLKCGGSYKTYTANFYSNDKLVEKQPYWHVNYYANEQPICTVDFVYDGTTIVPDNSTGDLVVSKNGKITYKQDGSEVFGIQYSYDVANPSNIKLKCLSILNMIGNKIVITADDGATSTASIEVEVEGL